MRIVTLLVVNVVALGLLSLACRGAELCTLEEAVASHVLPTLQESMQHRPVPAVSPLPSVEEVVPVPHDLAFEPSITTIVRAPAVRVLRKSASACSGSSSAYSNARVYSSARLRNRSVVRQRTVVRTGARGLAAAWST